MHSRPTLFSQLVNRLIAKPSQAVQTCGPLIASATELSDQAPNQTSPLWVILHSITESNVRLIHSQPLHGKRLAVQISASSGEVLRVQLATSASHKNGELYETTAEFLS